MGYTINIDINAIKQFMDSLKTKDRIQILQYLQENLWKSNMRDTAAKMQRHVQKAGITDKEIDNICKEARKKHHGND